MDSFIFKSITFEQNLTLILNLMKMNGLNINKINSVWCIELTTYWNVNFIY